LALGLRTNCQNFLKTPGFSWLMGNSCEKGRSLKVPPFRGLRWVIGDQKL
jgi:hypothetical protein